MTKRYALLLAPFITNPALAQETDNLSFGGTLEVEAGYHSPYEGSASSDITLATAELWTIAQINPYLSAEISLLYEEDDTPLEVDNAIIHLHSEGNPFSLSAGQQYLPFGNYETLIISGPLTQDLGELRETAVVLSVEQSGFNASVYAFNGDNKKEGKDEVNNFGGRLGYGFAGELFTLSANVDYLNDLGDSDTLQEQIYAVQGSNDVTDYTSALSASLLAEVGPVVLIGEYTTALDSFDSALVDFNGNGAKPSAWDLEAGYLFTIADKEASFAVSYQGSSEALAIGLAEQRLAAAIGVDILANSRLSLEYALEEDYALIDGGTGEQASTITAQLSTQF